MDQNSNYRRRQRNKLQSKDNKHVKSLPMPPSRSRTILNNGQVINNFRGKSDWKCCEFKDLPKWLQDNDFLLKNYRPPLYSASACFKSIFRLHTETVNIWSHLLGCLGFIITASYFLTRSQVIQNSEDKLVFSIFFSGATACLFFSTTFHTLGCHSERVGKFFGKLDYTGIAVLITASFIPWLYYSFYCDQFLRNTYVTVTLVLGSTAIMVSLWKRFGEAKYRPLRTGLFAGFGLSGAIPAVHYTVVNGFWETFSHGPFMWLILMAVLYLTGALIYVTRIPERWFPGKFDVWFHSHQLMHTLVVAAAAVNLHGLYQLAGLKLAEGGCPK